jgi:hypothetical protein
MKKRMLRNTALAGSALLFTAMGASAENFSWSSTTDTQTMDPNAL